jgi:hypothetical protein
MERGTRVFAREDFDRRRFDRNNKSTVNRRFDELHIAICATLSTHRPVEATLHHAPPFAERRFFAGA